MMALTAFTAHQGGGAFRLSQGDGGMGGGGRAPSAEAPGAAGGEDESWDG